MVNDIYSKAYVEVLEIIRHFSEEDYKKISEKDIKFFEDNKDKNYKFKIDPSIDLDKQNISKEAGAIIVNLYLDYYATEEQKVKIQEVLELNQRKLEYEKRKKYNPDDLFKKDNVIKSNDENTKKNNEMSIVEYKETFFTKFKNFIIKLLKLEK